MSLSATERQFKKLSIKTEMFFHSFLSNNLDLMDHDLIEITRKGGLFFLTKYHYYTTSLQQVLYHQNDAL